MFRAPKGPQMDNRTTFTAHIITPQKYESTSKRGEMKWKDMYFGAKMQIHAWTHT